MNVKESALKNKKDILKVYFKNKTLPNIFGRYPSFYVFSKLPLQDIEIDFSPTVQDNLLYIHIPFCYSVCKFCNLYKVPFSNQATVKQYLQKLHQELISISQNTKGAISCIWIGWWTPNLLTDRDVEELFSLVFKYFDIAKDAHIELDIHPAFIRKSTLDIYQKYGVRLLSLGVQSFSPQVIELANRWIQNDISLHSKLSEFNGYDFQIHLDFIVWLPSEHDYANIHDEIDKILKVTPIHSISVNTYENSFNTAFFSEWYRVSNEENQKKRRIAWDIEEYIKSKYGITRINSLFIKHFFTNRYNVIGVGAWAFWYLRWVGIYRNSLFQEYMIYNSQKKFFKFDILDEKIMYILHNWDMRELSFLYREQFGTYLYEDFPSYFEALDKRFFQFINDKHIYFTFGGNDIANFYLIDLYISRVYKYYD